MVLKFFPTLCVQSIFAYTVIFSLDNFKVVIRYLYHKYRFE